MKTNKTKEDSVPKMLKNINKRLKKRPIDSDQLSDLLVLYVGELHSYKEYTESENWLYEAQRMSETVDYLNKMRHWAISNGFVK